ncbi:hypothetical protein NKI95_12975 [Mesorhizobium sp. M0306]|uniref:hypothetical protein n=1 Tax=Mesorhizobium sp. M0306 TaxID=2956932 RepID=UPI00333D3161
MDDMSHFKPSHLARDKRFRIDYISPHDQPDRQILVLYELAGGGRIALDLKIAATTSEQPPDLAAFLFQPAGLPIRSRMPC